ncbi:MAG: type II toxin-antitoxin system VapC family toxin [Promicromonosporaceae bacterium]|nr:type II toxin-antitoxin system VapC family toxin [Promicromonosporaceae bacterium]
MKGYLLDTNILSELRKKKPNPNVIDWFNATAPGVLYLSVLTIGEIAKGVELLLHKDPTRAQQLKAWLADITNLYSDRIIPIDIEIARQWGVFSADRTRPVVDTLLAATAASRKLTLATRNIEDFIGLEVKVFNPFTGI